MWCYVEINKHLFFNSFFYIVEKNELNKWYIYNNNKWQTKMCVNKYTYPEKMYCS